MTQVDFHIVPVLQAADRYAYAVRLVNKARSHNHRVLLAVDDEAMARVVSEALWSSPPESFLAHSLLAGNDDDVQIGWHAEPGQHHDVLVNLATEIPEYFSRFERVFEVVSQDPAVLNATRTHYKFYQDRGYPLKRHDLRDRV
ncbi:DNA polymerase III subunit chi [Saccharospirillum impatiens]|uniref:DNA polymerase III subunit chi n=1 Tax=Saccharospirillum impatiens TaxID=169438 RepID=UPI00041028FC|nr:DNA polymerase III subunit chi [Saccharospirillum impatiens]